MVSQHPLLACLGPLVRQAPQQAAACSEAWEEERQHLPLRPPSRPCQPRQLHLHRRAPSRPLLLALPRPSSPPYPPWRPCSRPRARSVPWAVGQQERVAPWLAQKQRRPGRLRLPCLNPGPSNLPCPPWPPCRQPCSCKIPRCGHTCSRAWACQVTCALVIQGGVIVCVHMIASPSVYVPAAHSLPFLPATRSSAALWHMMRTRACS